MVDLKCFLWTGLCVDVVTHS